MESASFVDTLFDGLIRSVEVGENLDRRWFLRNLAYLATKTTRNTADDILVAAIDRWSDVCGKNGAKFKAGIEWLRQVVKGQFASSDELIDDGDDATFDAMTTIAVACGDANWHEA